jgi:hypothetical protein
MDVNFQISPNASALAEAMLHAQIELQESKQTEIQNQKLILQAIRKVFLKNGLALSQLPSGTGKSFFLTTILIHKSGQFISSTVELMPTKRDMQGLNAALTYAMRQMAIAIAGFGGGTDESNRINSTKNQKAPPKETSIQCYRKMKPRSCR